MDSSKKCTVFILLGQSQAVGHAIPMEEEDKITTPLKNVYGLHRKSNQSFDISELTWDGYAPATNWWNAKVIIENYISNIQ